MDVEKTDSAKGTQSTIDPSVYGSQALMQNGVLVFKGNIFFNGGHADGNTASGTAEGDSITATQINNGTNTFDKHPMLAQHGTAGATGVSAWSLHPVGSGTAISGAELLANTAFLTQTDYRGAFDGVNDWSTWTNVAGMGYLQGLSSDNDNDTLILATEIASNKRTDPAKDDTDGDGAKDHVDTTGTNPDYPAGTQYLESMYTGGPTPSTAKLKGISTNATVTPSALMVAGVTITGGTKKVVFQVQARK